ncbi:hemolysin family protein [Gordonia jacobaea]|uniref:hemolysin family protein n=1 Tax=Gordonia jacobaea TaxID=122202 RepID=UPI003D749211
MSNPWVVLAVTVALIAASAFFVAVEFALIAARRHRIEDAAQTSRAARAALRSSSELSVLLAGSQLGITVCTLALGAVTKPAVHHWITPGIEALGAPLWIADVAGFILALIIVTFLHLVVGEMAPKSWAIAHPEKSAVLLAIPMRAFMWVVRPVLVVLNQLANWCLRRVGVQPVDQVSSGQDSATLRQLVDHSAETGMLDDEYHNRLSAALATEALAVGDVVGDGALDCVRADASPAGIQEVSRQTGHSRLLVVRGGSEENLTRDSVIGVVHVRDSLNAAADVTAADLARDVLILPAELPAYEGMARMRDKRAHIALVSAGDEVLGVLTLDDLLDRLLTTAS